MKIEELKNKKILILGYGKEGQSTEVFLRKALPKLIVEHADKNEDQNYLSRQKNYDLIIKTPGIPKSLITQKYTTATNIFFANCKGIIIGVTGTKGKSTTASLIYYILKSAGKAVYLVGNIGTPALSVLSESNGKDDIFVMELSSYQLDDIEYSPQISVILNLFPEHMNYHGVVENYYQAKKNIAGYVQKEDHFFYHSDYPELVELAKNISCQTKSYISHTIPVPDNELSLKGEHNKQNIQAALCVIDLFHVSQDIIISALKTFKPLKHRLEHIGTFKDITFYDDAISTTPQSTIAALNALNNVDTLFLGGQDRGYDFSELVQVISKKNINNIVLFPDSGEKIKKLLNEKSVSVLHILETRNMEEAITFAYTYTKKGGVCLLSTASPSYSVWKNFEEKGDLFKKYAVMYGKT